MTTLVDRQTASTGAALPLVVMANILWNIIILVGSLALFGGILQVDESFYDLGRPVQLFMAAVALLPGAAAVYASVGLATRKAGGRYAALVIDYLGAALGGFYLLHLWGVFVGMDNISTALLQNVQWVWGLALGYGLYWISGRLPEDGGAQIWLERIGIAVGMLALVGLLWFSNILGAASAILSTYSSPLTWLVTAFVIVSGALAYRMLLLGAYFEETPSQQVAWQGWLMLSPNIIGFMLFFAGPLLLSFYLSFTNDTVGSVPEFIGLNNYSDILSLQIKPLDDPAQNPQTALDRGYTALGDVTIGGSRVVLGARDALFWQSLRNTISFCMLLVPLSVIPALLLATILNSRLPGMKFFRALYFLPSVAAVVGTALIWRWLYDPLIGYINYALAPFIGFLNSTFGANINPAVEWLNNQGLVLISIVLLAAWQLVGFNTVLFLAGLQGIPRELYEAAYVDGANRWQQFRGVTLPMLGPTMFFVIITTIITGLQVFNEPYALISARPMPTAATTSVFYLYNRGFFRFEFGYASSVAWILFALIFAVTLLQFRISRSNKAYTD